MVPTAEQAWQFVVMINSGLPASDAIMYFQDPTSPLAPGQLAVMLSCWVQCRAVKRAQIEFMGKSWQDMSIQERIQKAVDKHYSELAYFLFSHNYSDLTGPEKQKADTCRIALEAKLAGNSGKMSALDQFFSDFAAKKKAATRLNVSEVA